MLIFVFVVAFPLDLLGRVINFEGIVNEYHTVAFITFGVIIIVDTRKATMLLLSQWPNT